MLLLVACSGPPADLVRAPRPLVYVAIGASDAVGVGAVDPARDTCDQSLGTLIWLMEWMLLRLYEKH